MENTENGHMTQVSFRIPKSLKEIVEKFVSQDCHVNPSDFFREALRDKIKQEAPELYAQLFKVKNTDAQASMNPIFENKKVGAPCQKPAPALSSNPHLEEQITIE